MKVFNSKGKEIDVYSVRIFQAEGDACCAYVSMETYYPEITIKAFKKVVFQGKAASVPVSVSRNVKTYCYIGIAKDYTDILEKLAAEIPDVSVVGGSSNLEAKALHHVPSYIHIHRVTGEVELSDIVQGKASLDTKGLHEEDSVRVRWLQPPLSNIEIQITAKWAKDVDGVFDVGSAIEGAFPNSTLQTLTGEVFEKHWAKSISKFNRFGYCVLKSDLEVLGKEAVPIGDKIAIKTTYRPTLLLGWESKHVHHEQLQMIVQNDTQNVFSAKERTRKLCLKVHSLEGEICDWESFFQTEKGKRVVEYALKVAKANLAYSSRALEIEFKILLDDDFNKIDKIDTSSSIFIHDERLSPKPIEGKIKAYEIVSSAFGTYARIKMGCVLGTGEKSNIKVGKIVFEDELEKTKNLLRSVSVQHHAENQINNIQDGKVGSTAVEFELYGQGKTQRYFSAATIPIMGKISWPKHIDIGDIDV